MAWVWNPFVAFLVIFLLNYYFLFYFINKNNQCNVCKYKYYLTTHTHMSEVEVYSVNKLTFWAMDKNVVGKKNSRPGAWRLSVEPLVSQWKVRWMHNSICSEIFYYLGGKPDSPDMSCCKHVLGINVFRGPPCTTSRWTTLTIFCWKEMAAIFQNGRHVKVILRNIQDNVQTEPHFTMYLVSY